MSGTRYEIEGTDMWPREHGGWVSYQAHQSLEAELTRLRSEIAHVRGHLEGYADSLQFIGSVEHKLAVLPEALREDAKRLEQALQASTEERVA